MSSLRSFLKQTDDRVHVSLPWIDPGTHFLIKSHKMTFNCLHYNEALVFLWLRQICKWFDTQAAHFHSYATQIWSASVQPSLVVTAANLHSAHVLFWHRHVWENHQLWKANWTFLDVMFFTLLVWLGIIRATRKLLYTKSIFFTAWSD